MVGTGVKWLSGYGRIRKPKMYFANKACCEVAGGGGRRELDTVRSEKVI